MNICLLTHITATITIITIVTTNIPMMKFRSEPGSVFDRVFYRKETFIIEKSGEPRAVIVPMREYKDMQRRKREAKTRLFAAIGTLQTQGNQYDPVEVQGAIDEAVEAGRSKHSV